MKKLFKSAFCILLALTFVFCLTACGGETDTEASSADTSDAIRQNAVGRYELEKIEWTTGTVASGDIIASTESAMGDMYLELFSDGTATLSLYGQMHDMEFTKTEMHEPDNKHNTYEFSVADGKAVLKNADAVYTFVKQ